MFGMGLPELGIVAVIVLALFGSSKLPQLGKGLGEAISGFRTALKGSDVGEIKKSEQNKI